MKKFLIIAGITAVVLGVVSCRDKRSPGRAYMPDMYYSRAYETYNYNNVGDEYNKLDQRGIHYDGLPVAGTMARGDISSYPYEGNDSGYALSANFKNPLDTVTLNAAQKKEAERIYLINCGICHGSKLDGNGPLWKGGDGPYPAAPRNLLDDYSKKLADGTMYHVIMYGKGQMGSYASQVKPDERWMIIKYIREKQGPAKATDSTVTAATASAADTTKTTR